MLVGRFFQGRGLQIFLEAESVPYDVRIRRDREFGFALGRQRRAWCEFECPIGAVISIWKFIDYYPSTTVPLVEGACPTPMGDCKYLGFFAIVNNLVRFVPTCVVRENRQLQVSSLSNL
jgi:hypothetical protein